MGIIYRLFHQSIIKYYDHIISLGYNCEVAYNLFKHNRFLESNLFAWTYIPSWQTTIETLSNIDLIGSEGFSGPDESIMYTCNATKIRFHGKTKRKEFQNDPSKYQTDKEELISRVSFLKNKFVSVVQENTKKLYIVKIRSQETNIEEKIETLMSLLKAQNNGQFDLLVILEEAFLKSISSLPSKENLYFRTVPFFAPDSSVTSKRPNFKQWQRIFDEFMPRYKLKKTKKYKFEDTE